MMKRLQMQVAQTKIYDSFRAGGKRRRTAHLPGTKQLHPSVELFAGSILSRKSIMQDFKLAQNCRPTKDLYKRLK